MVTKATEANLTFLGSPVFSGKVLRTYMITNFLFVKTFLTIPCIHYKVIKLNFAICLVFSLSSNTWEKPTAFGIKKNTKSRRQHAVLVLRLVLMT